MIKRICAVSGQEFIIENEDLDFYAKVGVITEEQKSALHSLQVSKSESQQVLEAEKIPENLLVGLPTLCPEERQRRRISYRNFRNLYQRKCDGTQKSIITMYHADQPFPVYNNEYWWGDSWEALKYGKEFDFSRPFFEQYNELAQKVPRFATFNVKCENCKYANMAWGSKDCYLVAGCVENEDCLYGHIVWKSKNCIDNLYVWKSRWCSECVDCVDCYDTHFSTECANCTESYFLHDCRSCTNCFGCTNLRQKEYCFMNEQLSKEEYEKKIGEIIPLNRDTISMGKKWLEKTKKETCVFPDVFGLKNESITGNHVYESKNCCEAFDQKEGEDSKFVFTGIGQKNSWDISFTGGETRFCVDCLTLHYSEDCRYCHAVNYSSKVDYSEFCFQSQDLFGCNGLRNKKYCILNKQYTKEEYEELIPKIIAHMKETGEWGEFFPISMSPFGYNEAIVQEYFPLAREEVLKKGYKWKEEEQTSKYIGEACEIPEKIEEVTDEILEKVLICEESGKPFKIQKAELAFYRKMNLPIPRLHPDVRHAQRMRLRNPRKLWARKCGDCQCEIQTTFSPERPEKVLCEKCYLKVVQ